MSLETQLKRLEHAAGIDVLCEVCAEVDRHLDELASIIAPHIGGDTANFPFIYDSFCVFCGRAEPQRARALDAEEATMATFVMTALDEGRLCAPEVIAVKGEWGPRSEVRMRSLLGDDWSKYQALEDDHKKRLGVLYQKHEPRFPYVCRVAGCTCEHSSQ